MEQNKPLDENLCIKCQLQISNEDKLTTVKGGIEALIEYSNCTNNQALKTFLEERRGTDRVKIHRDCQKKISNVLKRKPTSSLDEAKPTKVKTRRESVSFEWKRDCFFL